MSKFKMKSPYDIDPVARYEVPFAPDNMPNDSGLVAKANKNGTMIVDKNIPANSPIRKNAESHEDHHLKDMMDGKLDYDDKAVYHNLDGKGVKMVSRGDFQESDKTLPWEKDAYKAGDNLEEKDMRPNPEKLDGAPNMYQHDTPLSFVKQMGRKRREQDQDKVSMSERFGMGMVKKFGCGPQANIEVSKGTDISGNEEGESEKDKLKKQAKANAEAELAKKNYNQEVMSDGTIRFSKSAEGSATGTDGVVVGSKAKSGQTQATDGDAYIQRLLKQGKTREQVMEGSLTSSKFFDLFPSSTETATASDEYFKDSEKKITKEENPPTTITVSGGGDGGGKGNSGNLKRKLKRAGQDFKAKCKQGFFRKGSRCVIKGEKSIRKQLKKRRR